MFIELEIQIQKIGDTKMIYAQFEGGIVASGISLLSKLDLQYCVTLALGTLTVCSFAVTRYNVPTFSRTSIGDLAQLSPKSLAPDSRYRKGLYIYLFWLVILYLAFCFIGPKMADIPGFALSASWKDSTLWPIGAATVLMTIGALGDTKFPGNIENFFRRKAHEAAYIPTAVTTLAFQLGLFDLNEWLRIADRKSVEAVKSLSGVDCVGSSDSLSQMDDLTEGKLVTWIRGNVFLHCLAQLSGDPYDRIKAQDENRDATRFLGVLQDSIKSRLNFRSDRPATVISESVTKDLNSFFDGASVLLAATLLQATPDARELSGRLTKLGFKEIDSASPQIWTQFATFGVAVLLISVFVTGVIGYLSHDIVSQIASRLVEIKIAKDISDVSSVPVSEYTVRIIYTAASTAFLYGVMLIVLMYAREKRLARKQWGEQLGSYMDIAKWGGIPAALIATIITFSLPDVSWQRVVSAVLFNLIIALVGSVFFVLHMRSGARAGSSRRSITAHALGLGVWTHAAIALIATVLLSVVILKFNIENSPDWSVTAANAQFRIIARDVSSRLATPSPPFASPDGKAVFDEIESTLAAVTDSLPTTVDAASNVAFDELKGLITRICNLANSPDLFNAKVFQAGTCQPIKNLGRDGDDLRKNFFGFSKSIGDLCAGVTALKAYLNQESAKGNMSQYLIAGLFSLVASAVFGFMTRLGRIAQLRNEIDKFDDGAVERLKTRAAGYFGANSDIEKWLVTPNAVIGFLTPLEGVRYRFYRPSLFDSLSDKTLPAKTEAPPLAPLSGCAPDLSSDRLADQNGSKGGRIGVHRDGAQAAAHALSAGPAPEPGSPEDQVVDSRGPRRGRTARRRVAAGVKRALFRGVAAPRH